MLSEFFGLYLNVTALRAINNTAVQNAVAHGELNDNQLDDFNKECQGHSTKMGKKVYSYITKKDRAKTLQIITDQINQKHLNKFNSSSDDDSSIDDNNSFGSSICKVVEEEENKKKRPRNQESDNIQGKKEDENINENIDDKITFNLQLRKEYDDWGKKHVQYQSTDSKIKWSQYEKEYIKMIYDQYPTERNIWKLILDTLLSIQDENVRQQFHIKHLHAVRIKDALRSTKLK